MYFKPWSITVTLAVLLTGLWSMSGTFDSGDALNRLRATEQFFSPTGLVVASQGKPVRGGYSLFVDQGGSYISSWGPGQPLLFVPYNLIAGAVSQPLAQKFDWSNADILRIKRFIVSSLVSLSCLLVVFWLEILVAMALGCGQWLALGIAVLGTFGSMFWSMWKQGQEEVQLAICLLGMIYGWLRWQKSLVMSITATGNTTDLQNLPGSQDLSLDLAQPSPKAASQKVTNKWVWFSSGMVAIALLFRTTALPMVLASIWLFVTAAIRINANPAITGNIKAAKQDFWRRWQWLIIPQAVCHSIAIAILATYNYIKTGNPLKAGIPLEDFYGRWWSGITEPIWGIDKGIIWTNPWLLPALITTVLLWQYLSVHHRQLLIVTLFLFSASIAIYANWLTWAGDHTYGARFQVHLLPCLTVLLGSSIGLYGRHLMPHLPHVLAKLINGKALQVKILALALCILLQVPSISLIHGLEIYQAMRAGLWQHSTSMSPTQHLPQIPTRYKNFWLKLTTQAEVLPLPPAVPITGDPSRQFLISDADYYGAQRWNFWPWLSLWRISPDLSQILMIVWYVLVILSVSLWLLLAYWGSQGVVKGQQPH